MEEKIVAAAVISVASVLFFYFCQRVIYRRSITSADANKVKAILITTYFVVLLIFDYLS